MDLAEFLLARIAEDEAVVGHALAAIDADRTEYAAALARRTGPYSTVTSSSHCGQDMGPRGTVEATPGRITVECEAKRRVVTEGHTRSEFTGYASVCSECGSGEPYEYPVAWPCPTLRLMALPYADHPDYDEEWKP